MYKFVASFVNDHLGLLTSSFTAGGDHMDSTPTQAAESMIAKLKK
jgi:hypothetical protein